VPIFDGLVLKGCWYLEGSHSQRNVASIVGFPLKIDIEPFEWRIREQLCKTFPARRAGRRRSDRRGRRRRFEGLHDDLFDIFESACAHPATDEGLDFRVVNFNNDGLPPSNYQPTTGSIRRGRGMWRTRAGSDRQTDLPPCSKIHAGRLIEG
jgi:hypothetical protein